MNCDCKDCIYYDHFAKTGVISRNDVEAIKINAHLFKRKLAKTLNQTIYKRPVINTEDDGSYDEYVDNEVSKQV